MAEGAVGHAKELRGFHLDAAAAAESLFKEAFLEAFNIGLEVKSLVRKIR